MKNVAILAGGPGHEALISLKSAQYVLRYFPQDCQAYYLVLDPDFQWHWVEAWQGVLDFESLDKAPIVQWERGGIRLFDRFIALDAAFPIMHGNFGEDGHIQGFLTMLRIPYVGSKLAASMLCMHKHWFKVLMKSHALPVLPYLALRLEECDPKRIEAALGPLPWIIKPNASGSSCGVSCVKNLDDLKRACLQAASYDDLILVEPYLSKVREIECAVLMADQKASGLGEIYTESGFYDFENKYLNTVASEIKIPASLTLDVQEAIRGMAFEVCRILGVRGLARVDFFLHQDRIYLNEINTLPGMTSISMFPKLLVHDGYCHEEIIARLIASASF